jgi:hypothetical protein
LAIKAGQARMTRRRVEMSTKRTIFWLAAAATVTIAAGGLVYALTQSPSPAPPEPTAPPLPPREPPESRDLVAAADLRREAAVACNAARYDECLRLLDEARQKDPLGDRAKVVRDLRERVKTMFDVDGGKK